MNPPDQTILRGNATFLTTASAEVAEIVGAAGWDWLLLDLEHGSLGINAVPGVLRAVRPGVPVLARISHLERHAIAAALDAGCDGVVVPQVNSVAEARQAIAWAKYPPVGQRSVGLSRAQGYGSRLTETIATANRRTVLVVQIEHRDAVAVVEEIAALPGLDGVLVGPYDLSGSFGKLGQVDDPEVLAAMQRTREACLARGVPCGLFVAGTEAAAREVASGWSFLLISTDLQHLASAVRGTLEAMAALPQA